MPGEYSDLGSRYAIDAITGRAAGPGARTMYACLLTAAPVDGDTIATLAELTTAGYARQAVTFSLPANIAGVPESHNTSPITWGPFTGNPPNATYLALVSAASGTVGDFVFSWQLDTAEDANIGDSISIATGSLSFGQD